MSEPQPQPLPPEELVPLAEFVDLRDWLGRACQVIQTIALVLIAIALIVD